MKQTRAQALHDMYLVAEFGLVQHGEQAPYFSVTASAWTNKAHAKRWPGNPHSCGQMHDEVLRAFPGLADLVALHLSDIDGVPMHALANSRYHFENGKPEWAARLLRVSVEDLPATADGFPAFVDAQRERWASEAAAAIAKYSLTITQGA